MNALLPVFIFIAALSVLAVSTANPQSTCRGKSKHVLPVGVNGCAIDNIDGTTTVVDGSIAVRGYLFKIGLKSDLTKAC